MKFCKFVGNLYPLISANFCRFILIFHQTALIFLRVPIVFTLYCQVFSRPVHACRLFVSKDLARKPMFPVTLTKGESSALLGKSAVELTALAQPFCLNQAVGDLPQHLHVHCAVCRCKPIFLLVGPTKL